MHLTIFAGSLVGFRLRIRIACEWLEFEQQWVSSQDGWPQTMRSPIYRYCCVVEIGFAGKIVLQVFSSFHSPALLITESLAMLPLLPFSGLRSITTQFNSECHSRSCPWNLLPTLITGDESLGFSYWVVRSAGLKLWGNVLKSNMIESIRETIPCLIAMPQTNYATLWNK